MTVVATIHPDPKHLEQAQSAVMTALPGILAEDGCEQYRPLLADDGTIVIVEQWSSREALAEHNTGPAVEVLRWGLKGLTTAATEVVVATAIA